MTLQFKNLNVASLDYTSIVTSIKNFLKSEPTLSDIDFDNNASAASMLVDILATATAYNGIYSQFGYKESFLSTASLLPSIVGAASNASVLLEVKKSASTTVNVQTSGTALSDYTPFNGTATDGSSILFFNTESVPASSAQTITLYCGTAIGQYTNWDYTSNSIILPLTVDPETISFYMVDNSGTETKWTKVDKSSTENSSGQYYFTVLNTSNGYLVTTNLPESFSITTAYTVYCKAVISNGAKGNQGSVSPITGITFLTSDTPDGGYDYLVPETAKAKVQFAATAQHRCVTLDDYEKAILNSNIGGITQSSDITVANSTVAPCTVNIYVDGLSSENSTALISYLSDRAVAGINLVYTQ